MSKLEGLLAAADEGQHPGLNYKLPAQSRGISGRRQVQFYPSGNSFSSNGVRGLRFDVAGGDWLIPDTVALQCKFVNDDGDKALAPISSELHCLFEQLTISISGQIVEQIGGGGCSYGRIVEMLNKALSSDKRISDSQFGFGTTNAAATASGTSPPGVEVPANRSLRVVHRPAISGLLSQKLALPLWAMAPSMQIEFLLVANATDAVDAHFNGGGVDALPTKSQKWHLEECVLVADVISLESMQMNNWNQFIRSGKAFNIGFRSYHNVTFSNTANSPTITVPKSYGRLCGVFVTMEKPPTYVGALGDNGDTRAVAEGGGAGGGDRTIAKHINQFYFPTGSAEDATSFLQVADVKLPDGEYKGIRPMLYRYQQSMGILTSAAHSTPVSLANYASNSFVLAFDTEKAPGMANTGLSTHSGSIVLVLQNFGSNADVPTKYHIVTYFDSMCSIGNFGCEVAF